MTDSNWQAAEEDALFDENEAFNLDKFVGFERSENVHNIKYFTIGLK